MPYATIIILLGTKGGFLEEYLRHTTHPTMSSLYEEIRIVNIFILQLWEKASFTNEQIVNRLSLLI